MVQDAGRMSTPVTTVVVSASITCVTTSTNVVISATNFHAVCGCCSSRQPTPLVSLSASVNIRPNSRMLFVTRMLFRRKLVCV